MKRATNLSYCFGSGREAYARVVMPANKNQPDACVPGPGTYDEVLKPLGKNARQFTIGPKYTYLDIEHMERKKGVPGPGYYEDKLVIDKMGKYNVSTYWSSKAPIISPS